MARSPGTHSAALRHSVAAFTLPDVPLLLCCAADYLLISNPGQAPTPKLKFTVTRQESSKSVTTVAAPAGSWTNAVTITKLPFLSARFNVGAEREERCSGTGR